MSKQSYHEGIKKMDDYRGRICILNRDIKTVGGDEFKAGDRMKIRTHHRGRLTMVRVSDSAAVRQISRSDLDLEATQ